MSALAPGLSAGLSAQGWNPRYAELFAWFRADLLVTLSAGKVTAWGDISGRGHSVSQASALQQPIPVVSDLAFGGQPVLDFRGSAANYKTLVSAAFTLIAQPITYYFVGSLASTTTAAFALDGSATSRVAMFSAAGGTASIYAGAQTDSAAGVVGTTPACWCAVFDSTDAVYVDDFITPKVSGNAGTSGIDTLTIGAAANNLAGFPWNGYIAEVIVRQGADSAAVRALMRAYFRRRYGI